MTKITLTIGEQTHTIRPEFSLIEKIEDYVGMNTFAFYRENIQPKPDYDAPKATNEARDRIRAAIVKDNDSQPEDQRLNDAQIDALVDDRSVPKKPLAVKTRVLFDILALAGRSPYADPPFSRDALTRQYGDDGFPFLEDALTCVAELLTSSWIGNKRTEEERKAAAELGQTGAEPENPTRKRTGSRS